ncbi:MAG: hypothetical protein ABL898_13260 [Hyphomicrobiaceae bacterium]|nr:hypothetical protein [Hyphomicrobiaceae bacterium]
MIEFDTALQATIPPNVTVCITSCARLDLLSKTLDTFRRYNRGGKFLISEDSCDPVVVEKLRQSYPGMTILWGSERLGIMRSIDRLYLNVETEIIFHLEDDWEFSGAVDWNAALALLNARPDIVNICVRAISEMKEKYLNRSEALSTAGASFRIMHLDAHPEYYSWSPNPGFLRRTTYDQFAPFSRVNPDQMSGLMKKAQLRQAFLLPGVAHHIGYGRNVTDPTMPPRPKSKPEKWRRAIRKKLYYAGLRRNPF